MECAGCCKPVTKEDFDRAMKDALAHGMEKKEEQALFEEHMVACEDCDIERDVHHAYIESTSLEPLLV